MTKQHENLTKLAKSHGWNIFIYDWGCLNKAPVSTLEVLVGQSLGIHEEYLDAEWLDTEAFSHFSSLDTNEEYVYDNQASQEAEAVGSYSLRLGIAIANLAPDRDLKAVDGHYQGGKTLIKRSDFFEFAYANWWTLPDGFKTNSFSR